MRLYLAGPMRGIPDFNFPVFYTAAAYLRSLGYDVFNPAEEDHKAHGNDVDPATLDIREVFERDTRWICQFADGVALLPGWDKSLGARAELSLARALSLRVRYLLCSDTGQWMMVE